MLAYNKLKIAIFTLVSSPSICALTFEPIEILSGSGNLLYAEIKYKNANPSARIEASLAEAQDFVHLGATHQPTQHLNFFTRKVQDTSGVIVITSSRPMLEAELNLLLKVKEGNATHIQQFKKPLNRPIITAQVAMSSKEHMLRPKTVLNEKDIALNLPINTQVQSTQPAISVRQMTPVKADSSVSSFKRGTPLILNVGPVPALNTKVTTPHIVSPSIYPKNQVPSFQVAIPQIIKPTQTLIPVSVTHPSKMLGMNEADSSMQHETLSLDHTAPKNINLAMIQTPNTPVFKYADLPKIAQTAQQSKVEKQTDQQHTHIVQANESLWKIAAQISSKTNQTTPAIMQKIQADNAHAFIAGDINRMRRGVSLNLSNIYNLNVKAQSANDASLVITKNSLAHTPYSPTQTETNPVIDMQQNLVPVELKEKISQNQIASELSPKIMTAHEKTVKLQKNISNRLLALQHKDQKFNY